MRKERMPDYEKKFTIAHDEAKGSCTIRFRCFDTPNIVTVYTGDWPDSVVEDLLIGLYRECLTFHFLWSFSLPESDVSRLNQPCGRIQVDERTARLLVAMQLFNMQEPSFDFTIGPVSYLWKHAEAVPSEDEITEALSHVGADKVELEGCTVVKRDPLVRIDVGGAAKGFVADELARMVREAGVKSADIDLGGNLYLVGRHPEDRPWRVAVRIPDGVKAEPVVLEVENCSVVTSGSYERFVEIGGKRYQHVIDARTGWPVESDLVSATVVSPSSLQADLLATTALMAGSSGIDALRARHPECLFTVLRDTCSG